MADDSLLGKTLKQQYSRYYQGHDAGDLCVKRGIAAADSFGHLDALIGRERFEKILDVGAGEGSLLALLDRHNIGARLYGVEISESGLDAIRARQLPSLAEASLFNGYEIPYPAKFFDLATAIHVLEHVEHERLFLRELKRVARRVIVEVPLENGLRARRAIDMGRPYGHINFYTPETALNLLATSGLTVMRSIVQTSSRRYEQLVAGRIKGAAKHGLRRALLAGAPQLAPWLLNYLLTAYCAD